jgi:hypothetical protein
LKCGGATFEAIGGFGYIFYGDNDIEDDLDIMLLNAIDSTIGKWRKFKLPRWAQRNPFITFEPIGGFVRNFVLW